MRGWRTGVAWRADSSSELPEETQPGRLEMMSTQIRITTSDRKVINPSVKFFRLHPSINHYYHILFFKTNQQQTNSASTLNKMTPMCQRRMKRSGSDLSRLSPACSRCRPKLWCPPSGLNISCESPWTHRAGSESPQTT